MFPVGCSTPSDARDEPRACYQSLDCRDGQCPTYAQIIKEIERDAIRVTEHRTQWLAWMRKKRPEVTAEDAKRVVRVNPAGWRGPSSCGEFTVFSSGNGYTGASVYFDRDLRLVAMRTTTDVDSGNPECDRWTHYGPAITCAE